MTDRERIVQLEQEIDRLTDYSNGLNRDLVAALELVQATRLAALEEAAKVCETHVAYYSGQIPERLVPSATGERYGHLFAALVRSLAQPQRNQTDE